MGSGQLSIHCIVLYFVNAISVVRVMFYFHFSVFLEISL